MLGFHGYGQVADVEDRRFPSGTYRYIILITTTSKPAMGLALPNTGDPFELVEVQIPFDEEPAPFKPGDVVEVSGDIRGLAQISKANINDFHKVTYIHANSVKVLFRTELRVNWREHVMHTGSNRKAVREVQC